MNQLYRPYPFQVRPLHRETSESYTRRLLAANFDSEQHRQHLLYASGARTVAAKNVAWTELLKVKTGRTDLRLEANEHGWLRHPDGTSCSLCADLLPARWMCTRCSHGALVEQHPHFDEPVCIRHHRWVGILGQVADQHRVSADHIQAALRFRKLRRSGQLDVRMYRILIHALSEDIEHSPRPKEAQVFPTAIHLAWQLTRTEFSKAIFDPFVPFRTAYRHLADTVAVALGRRSPRVTRAIWLYLRGTMATLRSCLSNGEAFSDAWPHDFPLNPEVASRFTLPPDGLQPFSDYLKQTGDSPASAAQYTLVGVEQRPLPATGTPRRRELAICSNGHQFEADTPRPGVQPPNRTAPACPVCRGRVVTVGSNDLATTHPNLAVEFALDLNNGLGPEDIAASTRIRYWWRCANEHTYQATPNNRTSGGSKCPVCLQRKVIAGVNDVATTHPDIAAEWHPSFLLTKPPATVPSGSKEKILWQCENEHSYWMRVNERTTGRGCPACARTRAAQRPDNLAITHPQLAAEWHPTLNGGLRPEHFTAGSAHKACWLCPKGHEYWTRIERRTHGYNCKVCSHRVLVRNVNDLATTDAILVTEYDTELNSRPASTTFAGTEKVWWRCTAANHEVLQSVPNRRKTRGCLHCPRYRRVLVD